MDSSSLSLPSSLSRNWKHHVFPSFHGPDVRKDFLSYILKEFRSKGIDPFIDNDIERSKSIGPELIEAIRGSKIAIVLLSMNYPSSTWCLDELVEIMKCREDLGQIVMPIFYKLNPTDVKKQTGSFGKVFEKHCEGKTKENIERWRQVLVEVGKIAGYHSCNWDDEAAMVEKIAIDISNKLNILTSSSDFDHFVGMEAHMEKMESFLSLDMDEVRMIGIWGPPGIGKTTIARFLFHQLSNRFQLSVFMENIKTRYTIPACSDDYPAKLQLQQQFMSKIINQEDFKIANLGIAQQRLQDKKVLVVLDDVDQLVQLDAMAKETCWFGPGSRIIITTQYQNVLRAHRINHIYKVDFPSTNEAFQIFCTYAFGQKSPKEGFGELAWEVTYLSSKLPLGLKLMGSYFRGMSTQEWTKALPMLRTHVDGQIESILNYKSLEKVEEHLSNEFTDVRQGLHNLVERSLIYIDSYSTIRMDDLLLQLGREIVRKQSAHEPWKRQFLVDARDICKVLSEDDATSLRNLKWMDLCYSVNLKELPDLSTATKLKELNLQGCSSLLKLPSSIGNVTNLQKLDLSDCSSLVELPSSNGNLHKLPTLSLQGCSKLLVLPTNINLESLNELDLTDCSLLKTFPEISTNIKVLKLSGTAIEEVPPSVKSWPRLDDLHMSYCEKLRKSPHALDSITVLDLNDTEIKEVATWVKRSSCVRRVKFKECRNQPLRPHFPSFLAFFYAGVCESMKIVNYSFCQSEIHISYTNCSGLDHYARDSRISGSTCRHAFLPSGAMPVCFTYRAIGDSVKVKLHERSLPTPMRFMACIVLAKKSSDVAGVEERVHVTCTIIDKQNGLAAIYTVKQSFLVLTENMFTVEVREKVSCSKEFLFEFKVEEDKWEIRECGVFEHVEVIHVHEQVSS
ncbi:unnamed protein product [Microthlaspi erraticum]|uniref:ADP-ribosyl cyclase/cyclic ADP-ribose hydrolase n=1 Tax=Microthlaspi erraticum TaxID=1685480 RepID=A0A6D2KTW5_9BRAS|nr:unnamed protein product [Microthlaspi erraticum]CAA7051488.1 unnamed protein product [Microthlaspi erraticum]